jgi:hypothetical protein
VVSQEVPDSQNNFSHCKGPIGDTEMSDVDEGDNRGSTVQDPEQLHSDILKRKFDRYKDQIYVLVQSFNRQKNNELVELEGLKEFITELMFLIRIKL